MSRTASARATTRSRPLRLVYGREVPLPLSLPVAYEPSLVAVRLQDLWRWLTREGRSLPEKQPFPAVVADVLTDAGFRRGRGGGAVPTNGWTFPCVACRAAALSLYLTPDGWACLRCAPDDGGIERLAARYVFGLRIDLRGKVMRRIHRHLVRKLTDRVRQGATLKTMVLLAQVGDVTQWSPGMPGFDQRFVMAEARRACHVEGAGPIALAVRGFWLDAVLEHDYGPAAYRGRCARELASAG